MQTFIRKIAGAGACLSLCIAAVPAFAQADNEGFKPEVYNLLVDCGTANFVASSGAEDDAQTKEYEGKATAFYRVSKVYGSTENRNLEDDAVESLSRVRALIDSDDPNELTELLTKCVKMEETVMQINSEL